jgi:type II secretory pathway pseudopilin PulG
MVCHFLERKAFSFIEIAISLSIVTIILLALLSLGGQILNNINGIKTNGDLNVLAQACQQYYLNQNHWPKMTSDLQPYFLNNNINGNDYVFQVNTDILTVISKEMYITVVKPRLPRRLQ